MAFRNVVRAASRASNANGAPAVPSVFARVSL